MTIAEYIEKAETNTINGIKFDLYDVNYDRDADVSEKFPFESDEVEMLSFLERLDRAKEELAENTNGMTVSEAFQYYKENTEDGNSNYWGGMVYVPTGDFMLENGEPPKTLLYGVRMD